ncbi:hypothetical protein DFH09DRAFT_1308468 [Mycena vulgaris]|nr:hypothetical protein DFH09DRAFT_1308468 [Mycena vulgaris]
MAALDLTIGCLLFASWANMILFTLQCMQTYRYFSKYPNDIWFNKGSVLLTLCSDFTTVLACLSSVYLYMVTHWDIPSEPTVVHSALQSLGPVSQPAVVQVWLTRMVWNLTRQWFWIPTIGVFILTGITGSGATAGQIFLDSSYTSRLALSQICHHLAIGMCRSGLPLLPVFWYGNSSSIKTSFVGTKDLLRRLSIAAVRNGSITTIMTLIAIIVFKIQPETNSATMIEMTMGRIYTLSMLSNLNDRILMLAEAQGSSGPKRTNGVETTATVLRIRQDVETHYQSDADAIPMRGTTYGTRKADLESGDGSSDRDCRPRHPCPKGEARVLSGARALCYMRCFTGSD